MVVMHPSFEELPYYEQIIRYTDILISIAIELFGLDRGELFNGEYWYRITEEAERVLAMYGDGEWPSDG